MQCSGFIYALSTGSQFIEAGTHKKVIVVGADKMSSIIDYEDRKNCVSSKQFGHQVPNI